MREPTISLVAQSALPSGGRVFSDTLRLSIPPARVTLRLQVAARSLGTVNAIRIAGRPLSITPNCWTGTDPVISRIAPDTWLFQSALHDAADVLEAVRKGCGRRTFVVMDLTDAFVTITVEGAQSTAAPCAWLRPRFLAWAPSTRVHARGRGSRSCRSSFAARASSALNASLIARAAQYLYDWLQDAAAGLTAA